jgi:Uma2 family endonuclease
MAQHAAHFREWVEGVVIDVSPVAKIHERLTRYLNYLLDTYFEASPVATAYSAPFVMQVESTNSRREPDIQIILNTNPGQQDEMAVIGPADICIEIVSKESISRDYSDKFSEYQEAGVREYWIIDPLRKVVDFHRLDETGAYTQQLPDAEGNYQTPLLPKFIFHVPTLWLDPLPKPSAILKTVQTMMEKPSE